MNSTKRKFNTLLNSMGNKSTTSLSSPKNDAQSTRAETSTDPQKRRRISDTISKLNSHASQSNSFTTPVRKTTLISRSSAATSTTLSHKKSASLATATLGQDVDGGNSQPKYAPWDRAAFLHRLSTYSNLTDWTPKPARVNEVEWAKRGWVCKGKERVRCCSCNVEILVGLNRKKGTDGKEEMVYVEQNIEDALVDKYVELIVTSHEGNCLWRQRGCDDSIFKLSLNHAPTTLQQLRARYDELSTRKETLPYPFNMRAPPDFDLDTIIGYLPKDFLGLREDSTPIPATDINKVALLMALFGWQGHTHARLGSQVGSVSCQACFRILGLWLFKSKKVNDAGEEVEGATVNCLDVVVEHRDYCPWRNSKSQSGVKPPRSSSPATAAWEVVVRVIRNDHFLKTGAERTPKKPQRPVTPGTPRTDGALDIIGDDQDLADAESIREENDKKRWARLRRVKSLFNTRSDKKLANVEKKLVKDG